MDRAPKDGLWSLYAALAALAVDARQLREQADDIAGRSLSHQARAERLRNRPEQLARRSDTPPPITGE